MSKCSSWVPLSGKAGVGVCVGGGGGREREQETVFLGRGTLNEYSIQGEEICSAGVPADTPTQGLYLVVS